MNMRYVLVFLVGCITKTIVAPTAPTNAAVAFSRDYMAPLGITAVCTPWTGHGAAVSGVDSVLCHGPTWVLYCVVPPDSRPRCEPEEDWTPKKPEPQTERAPKSVQSVEATKPEQPAATKAKKP